MSIGVVWHTSFESEAWRLWKRNRSQVDYDDLHEPCAFRADLVVEELVVVELKAKTQIHPIDKTQTLSCLRLMNLNVGLLINFHEAKLIDGLHRIVNRYGGGKPS